MPELPEVETIARWLRNPINPPVSTNVLEIYRPGILGRTISGSSILWERTIQEPDVISFQKRVSGMRVETVNRRGKYLVIKLSKDWLLIHLRMSGDIRVETQNDMLNKTHDRVIFHFNDQSRMVFNDTRKFGRIWLVDDPQKVFCELGPEPLSDELTSRQFFDMLNRRACNLKPLLMNQNFIAGLGNIYTDEALHRAGIHPLSISCSLTYAQTEKLLKSIRQVLIEGIRRNGASIDWVYRGGDFQNYFLVYQRDGEPCRTCGTIIERIVVGQRGTHYCPRCQPLTP